MAAKVLRRPRPSSHKESNDAFTRSYGKELRSTLNAWARTDAPLADLAHRLTELASIRFFQAYLSGKQQSYPHSGMTRFDWMSVNERLAQNASFVNRGLVLDIQRKLTNRPPADDAERVRIVDRSFGARVENMYGGKLWSVHELGHVNGWRQLARYTRLFLSRPILQQDEEIDTGEELDYVPTEGQQDTQVAYESGLLDAATLALALGISVSELDSIMAASLPVRFGVHYEDAGDEEVCEPCVENAEENDGDYWEPEVAPIPGDNCRGGGNCRCSTSEMWQFGYA